MYPNVRQILVLKIVTVVVNKFYSKKIESLMFPNLSYRAFSFSNLHTLITINSNASRRREHLCESNPEYSVISVAYMVSIGRASDGAPYKVT